VSLILKLLPPAAIGPVVMASKGALERNFNIVDKVRVATTAGIEIKNVAQAVYMEWIDSDTLPLENFSQFLRDNMEESKGGDRRDRACDSWGTPYRLARVRTGFEIQCAGPDKQWHSADDIVFYRKLDGVPDVGRVVNQPRRPSAGASGTGRSVGTRSAAPSASPQPKPLSDASKQKVLEFQQKRAAEGSASAQFDLALRYLSGDGVERNEATARSWLLKAAAGGNSQATKKLQELDRK
jgi:hypothetical protein